MRELKFRAWDGKKMQYDVFPTSDNTVGRWIETGGGVELRFCDGGGTKVDIKQFTGLKDKNGKEIYGEGDIYKDANGIISIVKMAVDGWALFPIKKDTPVRNLYWHNICDKTKGEVIGNTHQNPELLEEMI